MEKAITWHTFKISKNGDIQWIWSSGWEWWAVSGVIGRWSWFYLHIYAAKYALVGTTLRCRRNSRRFEAGVAEKKFSNRTMVDKGFGGRQYQKTTLASNPKRDYPSACGQIFSYIMARTSYVLMRWWWCLFYTWPTTLEYDLHSTSSLKKLLIDWLVFNANISNISAISWRSLKRQSTVKTSYQYTTLVYVNH